MATVVREIRACVNNEIYPRHFKVGDEVFGADADALRKLGCVEPERQARKARKTAPENKGQQ